MRCSASAHLGVSGKTRIAFDDAIAHIAAPSVHIKYQSELGTLIGFRVLSS